MAGIETSLADLADHVGEHLGYTDWQTMQQERVDTFADATNDHQFIHVDPQRAKDSPFGRTVAHGFLTLSLAAPVMDDLLTVTDQTASVNYGLEKVRFPAPLPVGERWRGGVELLEVTEVKGGRQARMKVTVEVQDADKPAMVAECLVRMYA